MAKAKSKVAKVEGPNAQDRVNLFAKAVQEASDKYQIGLGMRLLYNQDAVKPDLYYIDLVEMAKKQNEQAPK